MIQEPVHQDKDGKWYFFEETWAFRQGPFKTEKETREAFNHYCMTELYDWNEE